MAPPTSWATTNPGTEPGAIPAKVSEKTRPIVTAGFANEVDEVNQYAAPMWAPPEGAAGSPRPVGEGAKRSTPGPAVAMASPSHRFAPVRSVLDSSLTGTWYIR